MLCAFALLVVVISVLMFGLATLDNQNRSDAEQRAQQNATAQVDRSAQLAILSQADQNRSNTLKLQARRLDNEAAAAQLKFEKQVNGIGGAAPGVGPLALDLRRQALTLNQQSKIANTQAGVLYHQALTQRTKADQLLENSITSLAIGRRQAAVMSVKTFPAAVLTGAAALWFSTKQSEEKRDGEEGRAGQDAEAAEQFVLRSPETPAQPVSEHDGEETSELVSESGRECDGEEGRAGQDAEAAEQFVLRSPETPAQPVSEHDGEETSELVSESGRECDGEEGRAGQDAEAAEQFVLRSHPRPRRSPRPSLA